VRFFSSDRTRPAPDHGSELTIADEIFALLDGQRISVCGRDARLQIVGVHLDGTRCWVQFVLHGREILHGTACLPSTSPAVVAALVHGVQPDDLLPGASRRWKPSEARP
jgi:hypothetical protein